MISIHELGDGAILVDEVAGQVYRVVDGDLEPLLAGGHPRPGCAHATAIRPPAEAARHSRRATGRRARDGDAG